MRAETLAMRDPALASLLGVLAGAAVASAPVAASASPSFGEDGYEDVYDYGDYGPSDSFGTDLGTDFGVDVATSGGATAALAINPAAILSAGPAHPLHPLNPVNQSKVMGMWAQQQHRNLRTAARMSLIEPNSGSDIDVERYVLWLSTPLVLGTPSAITVSQNPAFKMRPQRVTSNAPAPGFATITEIKVANISVTSGGTGDAFEFNALGQGQTLDMPTITPAYQLTVLGNYTGFIPPGYVGGAAFLKSFSFKGPAHMVK